MDVTVFFYIFAGFIAQMIDGALGMGYGVSSTSLLLATGITPAQASASVHAAELVTTAVSGAFHLKFGNVDRKVLRRLVIPGIIGGALGAYVLTEIPSKTIKPLVAVYLIIMGAMILWKAFQKVELKELKIKLVPLGFVGGSFDAIGGGGWGPIVTTTLVARGKEPRFAVGSVNLAEFFVTLSESFVFILTIGLTHWRVIVGLMIGGALAAPLAAYVCSRIPRRPMMCMVGTLIIITSLRTLILSLR